MFLVVARRVGMVGMRSYMTGIRGISLTQVPFTILLAGISMSDANGVQELVWAFGIVFAELALLWTFRRRTRFGRIAGAYSLPGFRSGSVQSLGDGEA